MKTLLDHIKPLSVPSGAHKKNIKHFLCIVLLTIKHISICHLILLLQQAWMVFTSKSSLYQRFCLSRLNQKSVKSLNLEGCQCGHQSLENQCLCRLSWQNNFMCNCRYYYVQGMFMVGFSNVLHLRSWFSILLSSFLLSLLPVSLLSIFYVYNSTEIVHRGSGKEAQLDRFY